MEAEVHGIAQVRHPRIAWIGPAPRDYGGVPYMSWQLLTSLPQFAEVEAFITDIPSEVPAAVRSTPGLRLHVATPPQWPSRLVGKSGLPQFVVGQASRVVAQRRLITLMLERHRERNFDAVLQFSQIEIPASKRKQSELPPWILHPEVHARGELRWHLRERTLALVGTPRTRYWAAAAMLAVRSRRQRHDAARIAGVIAPSPQFAVEIARDYGVAPERIIVVPNPIDLDRFRPSRDDVTSDRTRRLIFVSRLTVRKGLEMVVELSHRLADCEPGVVIDVIGAGSLWSDYSHLLDALHPRTARFIGQVPPNELPNYYGQATAMIAPSHYEPFGLVIGEALACGLPVIASEAVGAIGQLTNPAVMTFPTGDIDALEGRVRTLLAIDAEKERRLRADARSVASEAFAPDSVAARLRTAVHELSSEGR